MCRKSDKRTCHTPQNHTPCPEGYVAWHAWAEKKMKTHCQERCPGCGLYKIWRKKDERPAVSD